jgi:hypothetical protein
MTLGKKILVGVATVVVAFVAPMIWYLLHHSMHPARSFEVNSPAASQKVLIASQGSAFKDSIVAGVVAHLRERQVYARVIDVSTLATVRETDWNAILLIHTWEMEKPEPNAKKFLDRTHNLRKIIVLTTSGAGNRKMEGLDAISSASEMIDVPRRVTEIDTRIDTILANP